MNERCKHIEKEGFHTCGSYAFNLWKDDIDQGNLCDVHYWQNKAQRKPLTDEKIKILWVQYRAALPRYLCFARAIEAAHGIKEQK